MNACYFLIFAKSILFFPFYQFQFRKGRGSEPFPVATGEQNNGNESKNERKENILLKCGYKRIRVETQQGFDHRDPFPSFPISGIEED